MKEKNKVDVELAQLKWELELLHAEAVPQLAQNALEEGYDGRQLRRVAGMNRPRRADLAPIIDEMFRELGRERVASIKVAGMRLTEILCEQIVAGKTPPPIGASIIWKNIYYALDRPKELIPFVGLQSEWDDCPEFRKRYEADIVIAAKGYLNQRRAPSG